MRIEAAGTFGCPLAKADLGFPEQSASTYDLKNQIAEVQNESRTNAGSARPLGIILGIITGLFGLGVGLGAWMKVKRTA